MKRSIAVVWCLVAAGWLGAPAGAKEPDPAPLRAALAEMHAWVHQGGQLEGWRAYLLSDALEAELAKGAAADKAVLHAVLRRYTSQVPGITSPAFVRVRDALESYLEDLATPSLGELAAACRSAKDTFTPIGPLDVTQAKAELAAALKRLEAVLAANPDRANATSWHTFLQCPALQAELAKGAPDLAKLDEIHARFAAGHPGLELAAFADVRRSLRRYLVLSRAAGHPEVETQYKTVVDRLAQQVASYAQSPSSDGMLAMSQSLGWLEDACQAPALRRAIARHFSEPNLRIALSAGVVAAGLSATVDETTPIEDQILDTSVRGTDHTQGQTTAELVPSLALGQIDLVFRGTTNTDSVGYSNGATVHSTSLTRIEVRKRILLDGRRASSLPAQAAAAVRTTLHRVQPGRGGLRAQQEAWRRAEAQREPSDRVAEDHARTRAASRMDQEIGRQIESLNQRLDRWWGGFDARGAMPEVLRAHTAPDALHWTVRQGAGRWLAAPAPPPPADPADLVVEVHESLVNNGCARVLPGMVFSEDQLRQWMTEIFGPLPQRFQRDPGQEPWTVRLAAQWPITVRFEDNTWTVTLRGDQYVAEGREFPELDITLAYRIEQDGSRRKAVRAGGLRVFPRGFVSGKGAQLSARQQALRNILERRLTRLFDAEWIPDDLVLPEPWNKAGPLRLAQWRADRGWMVLAWRRKAG